MYVFKKCNMPLKVNIVILKAITPFTIDLFIGLFFRLVFDIDFFLLIAVICSLYYRLKAISDIIAQMNNTDLLFS